MRSYRDDENIQRAKRRVLQAVDPLGQVRILARVVQEQRKWLASSRLEGFTRHADLDQLQSIVAPVLKTDCEKLVQERTEIAGGQVFQHRSPSNDPARASNA